MHPENFPAPKSQPIPATVTDAPAIAALANLAFRGDSSRKGWTTEADLIGGQRTDAEKIAEKIQQADSVFLIVKFPPNVGHGDRLLACVHLEKKAGNIAYLGMLTVDPENQSGKVGRFLLKAAEDFVKMNWQSNQVQMTVITVRKELIAWYVRRGYEITSARMPFPSDDPRNFGVPKREDLEFVVLTKKLS